MRSSAFLGGAVVLGQHKLRLCMLCSYKRLDDELSDGHRVMATERDQTEADCEKVCSAALHSCFVNKCNVQGKLLRPIRRKVVSVVIP